MPLQFAAAMAAEKARHRAIVKRLSPLQLASRAELQTTRGCPAAIGRAIDLFSAIMVQHMWQLSSRDLRQAACPPPGPPPPLEREIA